MLVTYLCNQIFSTNTMQYIMSVTVYRWVRWTSLVVYWEHSLASACLGAYQWTVKVTCWSLAASMIAFCCWTVNYSYNASSLTTLTLKSSCGCQHDYVTTNSHHDCTLRTATDIGLIDGCLFLYRLHLLRGVTPSHRSICDEHWLRLITAH